MTNPSHQAAGKRRLFMVAVPSVLLITGFRIWDDLRHGLPLRELVVLNGVPLVLIVALFCFLFWFLFRPGADGQALSDAQFEARRSRFLRKVVVLSIVVHSVLAAAILLGLRE